MAPGTQQHPTTTPSSKGSNSQAIGQGPYRRSNPSQCGYHVTPSSAPYFETSSLARFTARGLDSHFGMECRVVNSRCCEPLPRSRAICPPSRLRPATTTMEDAEPVPNRSRSLRDKPCPLGSSH
uniref:Uncharacterized protein n=1 Tax=Knipowitschia caucasica TaxID=637954 RepID=A0AAV2J206_KNICA